MKILHVNENDLNGGAARAAYRLHKGLCDLELESIFFVKDKNIDDYTVVNNTDKISIIKNFINYGSNSFLKLLTASKTTTTWSANILPFDIFKNRFNNYDIINLHWINNGFIGIKSLKKINKPIVWTLHDSWAFTGGCHIPYKCRKYENKCFDCPQIFGKKICDLSEMVFQAKKKYYPPKMTIVCPSMWLASCAKNSLLLKDMDIKVIPNGLNIDVYKIRNKKFARDIFNVDEKKIVILFGAVNAISDENKGYTYLYKAIRLLYENNRLKKDVEIIIFGSDTPKNQYDFGFKVRYVGRLHDDITLNLLYSVADVMVIPSKSESFGQTVIEAMASGTPCVAFNCTGIKDIIDHKNNGYLALPYDFKDLSYGIEYILENAKQWKSLSYKAREKVVNSFDIKMVSKRYYELYNEIIISESNGEKNKNNCYNSSI